MSQEDHSEPHFLPVHSFMLKSWGVGWWGGGVGGPCDFSVSPRPFGLDFGTMDSGTSDLGLTITIFAVLPFKK